MVAHRAPLARASARERSAIMIIVSFIAFIQAIIIFDYSETPPYGELCNTVT